MQYQTTITINSQKYRELQDYLEGKMSGYEIFGQHNYGSPLLVAKKEFEDGKVGMLIFDMRSYNDVAITVILTDKDGIILSKIAQAADEIVGYDMLGDYVIPYGDNTYTVTLETTDHPGDMAVLSVAEFSYSFNIESLSDFIIPAEPCSGLDITGMWGITLCNRIVRYYDIDIRYELMMSVRMDEAGNIDNDLCETIVLSDGKHYDKIIPVHFFEDADGENKLPERGSRKILFSEFAGVPFMFVVTRNR